MQEELRRQRIKGLVEVGGAADEMMHASGVSDCRLMGPIERYVQRHPLLKAALLIMLLASMAHSAWSLWSIMIRVQGGI